MKKNNYLIFTLIGLLIVFQSCHKKDVIDENSISEEIIFINEILSDSTIVGKGLYNHKIISLKEILGPPNIENFSKESDFVMFKLKETDSTYILKQFIGRKSFEFNDLIKFGYKIKNVEAVNEGLLTFSKPIFNASKNLVYFRYGFICGPLCGHGQDLILEKINGKWIVKETTGFWVS